MKLVFLSLTAMAQTGNDWKSDLKIKIPCGTTSIREQASLLKMIVGSATRTALQKQKFKHLSQYNLFIDEFTQLNVIRAAVTGPGPSEEARAQSTVRLFSEFTKEEGFLDPAKICLCAQSEGTREFDAKARGSNPAVTPELVQEWFARCIVRQFVPAMYKNPELEDKYD